MVIEGSSRDARGAHDLLGPDGGVAALGEQRARRLDERRARGLGLFGLQRPRMRCVCGTRLARLLVFRRVVVQFDMHAVCMLDTYCLYVKRTAARL